MSAQLQQLRADAAMRHQQLGEHHAPLQSPAASDFDTQSVQSLRSAASSRRSHLSRSSVLTQMASAKSEQFDSVHSRVEEDEEFENEDPNAYQDVKSKKSVVREENDQQAKTPHKEQNIFGIFTKMHFRPWRLITTAIQPRFRLHNLYRLN